MGRKAARYVAIHPRNPRGQFTGGKPRYKDVKTGRFVSAFDVIVSRPRGASGAFRSGVVSIKDATRERIGRGKVEKIVNMFGQETRLTERKGNPGISRIAKQWKAVGKRRGRPVFVRMKISTPGGGHRWISLPLTDPENFEDDELTDMIEEALGSYGSESIVIDSWQTGEAIT